jgi:hypothetical protein
MRKSDRFLLVSFVFVSGCLDRRFDVESDERSFLTTHEQCVGGGRSGEPEYCFEVTDPAEDADACDPKQWIGMADSSAHEGGCGSPAGWTATPVFDAPIATELDKYCSFEWALAREPGPLDFGRLPPWAKKDCNVIAPYGHPLEAVAAPELEAAALAQIGALDDLPIIPGLPSATKVVIVDSAVDQGFPNPGTGRFDHGQMMGQIVRRLGCPDGPSSTTSACLAAVASQLALPFRYNAMGQVVRDESMGGRFGNFRSLARAIVDAVSVGSGGNNRMVINISLGWGSRWGGSYSGTDFMTLDPGPRLVNSAIFHANCRGALIVAAAGNSSGGDVETGPAFPAGWAAKGAPNARCGSLGGAFRGAPPAGYPVLYAVGGMRGTTDLLLSSRPGGVPGLVAPAAHASAAGVDPHVYTGTSVAAAEVSAISAIVWGYLPTAHPKAVMDRVRNQGAVVPGLSPDFCLTGSCPADVRRAVLCTAIASACNAANAVACTLEVSQCPATDVESDADLSSHAFSQRAMSLQSFMTIARPCSAEIWSDSTPPVDPCPSRQYFTMYGAPWIQSSPGTPTCPACGVGNNSSAWSLIGPSLYLGIDADATGLSSPTLYVKLVTGDEVMYALDLDQAALAPGASIEVVDLPFALSQVDQAAIEFVIDGQYSSSDELLILD